MSVTLKELAGFLNVSIGTVSRALKDDPKIALSTRQKISELAQKLDYVPSNLGRSLQARKSFLLGFLVSNIKDSFYNEILQGIAQQAQKQGYGLLVGITGEDSCSERDQLHFFQQKSVDGIIISYYCPETIPALIKLKERNFPLVICDFEPLDERIPVILIDEAKSMESLAGYLISLGHSKIGFYYHLNQNSQKRYQILMEYLHSKGLPKPVLFSGPAHLRDVMTQPDRPTAVMAYSDLFAVEMIHILQEIGLGIPDDVSVTGFDDLQYASWPEFGLTTIFQPKTHIGELSVSILIDLIQGKPVKKPKAIKPRLIIRQSCRKLKK